MLNRPQEEEECKKDTKMGRNNRKCHPLLGWLTGMNSFYVCDHIGYASKVHMQSFKKKNIQSFSRNGRIYRETEKETNRQTNKQTE